MAGLWTTFSLTLQISEDGLLSPTTMAIFLVGGSFILAGVVHPQEFYCLPYGVIYYITIPAMYLLLVIYSIFNLNDVSWGTRDVRYIGTPCTVYKYKIYNLIFIL